MKIGIHGKDFDEKGEQLIRLLFEEFKKNNSEILLSPEFHNIIKHNKRLGGEQYNVFTSEAELAQCDFLFSLGGDGTLLRSVAYIGALGIPIVGVNMGRLGFLATTTAEDLMKAVHALYSGDYDIEKRVLLKLETNLSIFEGKNFALNDMAILKRDTSSMIIVNAHVNGEFLNSYWADGLIVSTPTGSTGYSLSCGGPLVLPQSNNFIITPISPHNLNVRPIVVDDNCELTFEVESRNDKVLISLDSRSEIVGSKVKLKVNKQDFSILLVKFRGYNFFDTLRQKLNWGFDKRNLFDQK